MDKIRTFVAVPLPDIPSLARWTEALKMQHVDDKLKWTDSRQWHVTLKFIGDIPASELAELSYRLTSAFKDVKSGDIVVEGIGLFGSFPNPRVLWAGIRESEWLKDLQMRTSEASSGFCLAGESNPFCPHLTLARINFLRDPSRLIEEAEQKRSTVWCEEEIDKVFLFQSNLSSKEPVYSILEQFEFG